MSRLKDAKCGILLSIFIIFSIVAVVPCFAQSKKSLPANAFRALANATNVTLYSLEPDAAYTNTNDSKGFHGYPILGKTELVNADAKKATSAFHDAIFVGKHIPNLCGFYPHHALRLTADGHTYDYMLCYTCGNMQVDEDGKPIAFLDTTAGSPEILNALLTAAHVPLSKIYSAKNIAVWKKNSHEQPSNP